MPQEVLPVPVNSMSTGIESEQISCTAKRDHNDGRCYSQVSDMRRQFDLSENKCPDSADHIKRDDHKTIT
jgi:hypothetical protein